MDSLCKKELEIYATKIRMGIIEGTYNAKAGHPGGSLSAADAFAYLYAKEMRVNPSEPKWEDRDRLVLSKGHCAPGLYSDLANRGYFPVEDLKTFRQTESNLQGHPDMKKTEGVDMTSGSLGQGASTSCGMALANKMDKTNVRIYAILGDGETEEGQVWEAAMFAAHYKLSNLCWLIDFNGLQIDGPIADVIGPAPYDTKFAAFGWNVVECNAHDFDSIEAAYKAARECKDKPTVIISHSTKGKGVSYMENSVAWHGAAPNDEQYQIAMHDLGEM